MPNISYVQTSFSGGEIAPTYQGRLDDEEYKNSLAECSNYVILEEGSLARRPGNKYVAETKAGGVARGWTFEYGATQAYFVEAGGGYFRFCKNGSLLLESTLTAVTSISSATPAEVTTSGSHPYSTNDYVMWSSLVGANLLRNRQFKITKTGATKFTMADPMSGAMVGTAIDAFTSGNVQRVYEITNPYDSGELFDINPVQDLNSQILLHGSHPIYILSRAASTDTFTCARQDLTDGPYLDPNTTTTTLTPDAVSGSITLTASSITGINNDTGFQATDAGRHVRLFSEPAAWNSGTSYVVGNTVKYNGAYYVSIKAGSNKNPITQIAYWQPATNAAVWSWGVIGTVTDTTHVVIALDGDALVNTNAMTTWRLGLFSDTTGWPSCGTLHEGRLWLSGGTIPNRVVASKVDDHFNFAPTASDGTAADDNGLDFTFESEDANPTFWMISTSFGLVVGTQGGEWLVAASSLDDPITPTSVQARRQTKFGCANVQPAVLPHAIALLQRQQRKIYEYKRLFNPTSYSVEPNGVQISLKARHLMTAGIEQMAYQSDPVPILWARDTDGALIGATHFYDDGGKRKTGWHKHPLGGNAYDTQVQSLAILPSSDGLTENLWQIVGRRVPGIVLPDGTDSGTITYTSTLINPVFTGQNGHAQDTVDWVLQDGGASEIYVTTHNSGGGRQVGITKYDYSHNVLNQATIDPLGDSSYDGGVIAPKPPFVFVESGTYLVTLYRASPACEWVTLNRSDLSHNQHHSSGLSSLSDNPIAVALKQDETYAAALVYNGGTGKFGLVSVYNIGTNTPGTAQDFRSGGGNDLPADGADLTFDNAGNVWIGCTDGSLVKYTRSGTTLTRNTIYQPYADGVGIVKLTHRPTSDEIILWYSNGRMARWHATALTGTAYTQTYTYHAATADNFRNDRWIATDNSIFASADQPTSKVVGFNMLTGVETAVDRSQYTAFSGNTLSIGGATYDRNHHRWWVSRSGNLGFAILDYGLTILENDGTGSGDGTTHRIEYQMPLFDASMDDDAGFFVDAGRGNEDDTAAIVASASRQITIYGLHYLEGETVAVMIDGVDAGDFLISTGKIVVPVPAAVPTYVNASELTVRVGYTYTSKGQSVRPDHHAAANGPAYGKTKRNHKLAMLLDRTLGIEIGSEVKTYPVNLTPNGAKTEVVEPDLFSGMVRGNIEATYDYSGQALWKQERPYPGAVLSVGGFMAVEDV